MHTIEYVQYELEWELQEHLSEDGHVAESTGKRRVVAEIESALLDLFRCVKVI